MEDNHSYRFVSIIGHLFFLTFLLGCIFYSKERFLAFDAAFYTFDLINNEHIAIRNQRYISYFTQFLALFAVKNSWALDQVLTLFSITFGIWYYLMFLLVNYVLKNSKGVLLLIFSLCLTLRYKHFAGHTEIIFAIMVSCLLFIWLQKDKEQLTWYKPWMHWFGLILLCAFLLIIHPVIVIPLSMIIITDLFYRNNTLWKTNLKTNILNLLIIWASFGLRFLFINSYETKRASSLLNSIDVLLHPSKYPIVYEIVSDYFKFEYFLVFPLFIVSIVWLMFQGKKWTSLSLLGSVAVLIILNLVAHSYLNSKILIMIDGYLGMLGMIFGLSYIYVFYAHLQKTLFRVLLSIFLIINVVQIQRKHEFFQNRLQAFDRVIELNENHPKLFINANKYDWEKMWAPYAIPFESLIWTSLKSKENGKIIYVDTNKFGLTKADNPLQKNILRYDNEPENINSNYFKWPTSSYLITDKADW